MQAVIESFHERWSMKKRQHRRNVRKVSCDQGGKKIWLRKFVFFLGKPHTFKFPLRPADQKNAKRRQLRIKNIQVACARNRVCVGHAFQD